SLVGPRLALTAAHCLINPRTRRFHPAEALHVVFGYSRASYLAHAVVERFSVGPGYDLSRPLASLSSDWALLTLADDASARLGHFQVASAEPGAALLHGGYTVGRMEVLLADPSCRLLGAAAEPGLVRHDCETTFGDSGGPLLERTATG